MVVKHPASEACFHAFSFHIAQRILRMVRTTLTPSARAARDPKVAEAAEATETVKRERSQTPTNSLFQNEIEKVFAQNSSRSDKKPRLGAYDSSTPKSKPRPISRPKPKKPKVSASEAKDESLDNAENLSTTKSPTRLPSSAKRMIAEEIIGIGAGAIDVDKMAIVVSRSRLRVRFGDEG